MSGDYASYLIRTLLSEGCIKYNTVQSTPQDGLKPKTITVEGPTGLITTTTRVSLHAENETRLLSVPVNDSREQTLQVMMAQAALRAGGGRGAPANLDDWHAFHSWIGLGDHNVVVPFALALARLIPPVAVRLRRDFTTILTLIQSHALIHQVRRAKSSRGEIVASIGGDYAAVRSLIADLVAEGAGRSVSSSIRETVEAVEALNNETGASATAVSTCLGLDKSTASRRLKAAEKAGYLYNAEARLGVPAKWMIGEDLPRETAVLPEVDQLLAAYSMAA